MTTEPPQTEPSQTEPPQTGPAQTGPAGRLWEARFRLLVLALIAALGGAALLLASRDSGDPGSRDPGDRADIAAAPGDDRADIAGAPGPSHSHAGAYEHTHTHTHIDGATHSHSHLHQHSDQHGHAAASADAPGEPTPQSPAAPPGTWTVEYTSEGTFVPERLDITTGDTVVFVNASEVPVWPASNIHPTHEIRPDFDPLEAIWPGESWRHTFDENGYWRYHNHIEASQTGLVVALSGPEDEPAPLLANLVEPEFPSARPSAGGENLFDDEAALRRFVETYGPAQTVAALKDVELRTGRDCHTAAHEAGRLAYEVFGPVAFAVSGHECQAGALHGATEALFADRGTARLADDVAALCANTLNRFVRHQCYHGVGHGLMAWTTYEIHEALEYCDVIDGDADAASCYSGVFMENVVGGLSGAMGHQTEYLRDDDPHFPCDVVEDRYRADCYYYQTTHMRTVVFDGDLAPVAAVCATLSGDARRLCFSSYGRDVGNVTRGRPAEAVALCGHAPAGDDRVECLAGAAQDRFWETTGADEAISMCSMLDDAAEADACWWTIIDRAGDVFSDSAGRRSFCDRLPAARRDACTAAIVG